MPAPQARLTRCQDPVPSRTDRQMSPGVQKALEQHCHQVVGCGDGVEGLCARVQGKTQEQVLECLNLQGSYEAPQDASSDPDGHRAHNPELQGKVSVFHILPGVQKEWRCVGNPSTKMTELVPHTSQVQDGDLFVDPQGTRTRGLLSIFRRQSTLCANPPQAQTLSPLLPWVLSFSLLGAPIRTHSGTKGLHKDSSDYSGSPLVSGGLPLPYLDDLLIHLPSQD